MVAFCVLSFSPRAISDSMRPESASTVSSRFPILASLSRSFLLRIGAHESCYWGTMLASAVAVWRGLRMT